MGSDARKDLSGRTAMQLFHVILSRCSLSFTLDANASAAPPPRPPSSACKGYPSSIHADFPLPRGGKREGRTGNPPPCTVWQPDMCAYPSSASLPFLLLDPLLFVRRLHVVRGVYYLTLPIHVLLFLSRLYGSLSGAGSTALRRPATPIAYRDRRFHSRLAHSPSLSLPFSRGSATCIGRRRGRRSTA